LPATPSRGPTGSMTSGARERESLRVVLRRRPRGSCVGAALGLGSGGDLPRTRDRELRSIAEILAAWADAEASLDDRRQRAVRGIEGLEQSDRLFDKGFFLSLSLSSPRSRSRPATCKRQRRRSPPRARSPTSPEPRVTRRSFAAAPHGSKSRSAPAREVLWHEHDTGGPKPGASHARRAAGSS